MIEIEGLTKRYGSTYAVHDLTFTVRPGHVTGFLGPNGAGKSTTMRMILGLDRPTTGRVRVDGTRYTSLKYPLRHVGALLDASAVHPGRTARAHLREIAASNHLDSRRVRSVLAAVGLEDVADRRVKGFSLGMRQRLGIATALLGNPRVLMFDEPVNGLDPEGIRWIRDLMRSLAADGKTVFVSSHLMSEMEHTADHLVVIGKGRLIADMSTRELIASASGGFLRIRSSDQPRLIGLLAQAHGSVTPDEDGMIRVVGLSTDVVGKIAYENGVALLEMTPHKSSLEEAYLELTESSVEYRGSGPEGRR